MDTTHRASRMPHTAEEPTPHDEHHAPAPLIDRDWDAVHDAALESFPASDPPSWSPLRVGAPRA